MKILVPLSLTLLVLIIQAATKAVAAAESRKREKKDAVVDAVVKAKSDRRVTRKAAKGMSMHYMQRVTAVHVTNTGLLMSDTGFEKL